MKLAYLTSRYPAPSHTFITREVLALRQAGVEVATFSVRRTPQHSLRTELDRSEDARTFAILPISLWRLLGAHLTALLVGPAGYLRALGSALTDRPPGLVAAIWQLFYFAEAAILARELRRRGVAHLHVHFANVASEVARLAARMTGTSWSLTLHGFSDFGDPVRARLHRKVAGAAFTFCVCDYGRAQAMLQIAPERWSKIEVARCGVDTQRFRPPPDSPPQGENAPLRLLTVGRLGREKGHAFLLRALRTATDSGVNLLCTLVGDGPERASLESLARDLRIADRVVFTGAVGHDMLGQHYRWAHVFVLPSLSEGLPIVLMEAMATGLPVIASRIAGIPELVNEGEHGMLVSPARPDELSAAIVKLAENPKLRRRLGAAGRERVVAEYDAREADRRLVERFRQFLAPHQCLQPAAPASVQPRTATV